jgi:glycosyltransferase involved in cell wall biosynthesis
MRISVVIPAYNHEAFVEDAVRSVFAQTYRPLELFVVDDGSQDRTVSVVRSLLDESPLSRAELITQPNGGAPAALATGIGATRGDVIAILNSDDYYDPDRLEVMAARITTGLAFSQVRFVGSEAGAWRDWYARALAIRSDSPTLGFALLSANFSVSSSNFVFTRALYEAIGGFSAHRFCHDWDFLMRSVLVAEPTFVERPLLSYRLHGSNATKTLRSDQVAEMSDALDRYLHRVTALPTANRLAPTPDNWPSYFPLCLQSRRFHFERGTIAEYLTPTMRKALLHRD